MAKQGVNLNVQDGGLGQAPPGLGNVEVVIGCSSTGTPYVPTQTANPSTITSTFGYGPGPELACNIISSTGNPVVFIQVPASTAGQNTAVIPGSSNTSASVMTITGTPQDTYYGLVTVLIGGTVGTVGTTGIQLGISLDAGSTTFQTINLGTATTVVVTAGGVTTGLTLNFTSATLNVGDKFFWISTEPLWTDAAVASAITTLQTWNQSNPEDIMVTGGSALRNGAGTAGCVNADVQSFDTQLTALFNKARYNRLLCAAGDAMWGGASTETETQWMTSVVAAHASDSSLRVGVTAGHYPCISAISQTQFRRPLLWFAAARDSAVAIQVDLGRVKDGSLSNMVLPTSPATGFANSTNAFIIHDETANPGFDAARFTSAWSIARRPGLFIMNPNLMAPPGSDFNWLQHGHVMDGACLIMYDFFVEELSDNVLVYPAGTQNAGQLLQNVSADLIGRCNAALANGLTNPGAASSAVVTIPGGQNLLSTAALNVNCAITPPGYLKAINITLQFQNPSVVQVSAS